MLRHKTRLWPDLASARPHQAWWESGGWWQVLWFHGASQAVFLHSTKMCVRRCLVKWYRQLLVCGFMTASQLTDWLKRHVNIRNVAWKFFAQPGWLTDAEWLIGWLALERKETSSFPLLCWAGKDGLWPADSCFLVDEGGMGAWVVLCFWQLLKFHEN